MSKTTYDIETSLTTDYRKSAWGIERIVLDSVSNHLPADSKGTVTTVRIKQDGQCADLKKADPTQPAEEVIFEDNGFGYDAGLLSVLFSPKAADDLSVGQFGEGLKLVATAAIRHGLKVEYRSRNWMASPYTKPENIGGHNISRLCFRVTENGDNLAGSRTVFTNPSQELMDEVFQLPNKVLALNDTYRELYSEKDSIDYFQVDFKGLINPYIIDCSQVDFKGLINSDIQPVGNLFTPSLGIEGKAPTKSWGYNSRIIDLGTEETALFIKGVIIQETNSIFSYDLGIENISPDRIFADRNSVLDEIESILKNCSNTQIIERVLAVACQTSERYCDEFEAFRDRGLPQNRMMLLTMRRDLSERKGKTDLIKKYIFNKYPPENLWVTSFRKLYGVNAVIASHDVNANKDAKLMGYTTVRLNISIANYLASLGIQSADKVTCEQEYKWVSTSDLTEAETQMLDRVKTINEVVLGQVAPVDVRVYSGLFLKSGREVECANGVHITEQDGTKYIGIKRPRLGKLEDFVETYVPELGHPVTGADDYDRRFTDFFVRALSKLAIHHMNRDK